MNEINEPWQNELFIGHQPIISQLDRLKNNNSLNNTLLFSGPIGIGKCTLAFRYSSYIFSDIDSSFMDYKQINNSISTQISNHSHPNLHYISNADENGSSLEIKIEVIRKLKEHLTGKLLNGGYRVIIIDTINDLNKSAQNALLKILEEPPVNTLFVLITHNISKVPDTILSRCLKFNFKNLSIADTKQVINHLSHEMNTEQIIDMYGMNASPGKIVNLMNNNFEEIIQDFNDLINSKNINEKNVLKIIKYYSKKENLGPFNILFELLMIWLKKNAISFLSNLDEDYKLYELLSYWDKYSDKYNDLNIFNLSREELLLNIHRDVWRLSDRKIDG